jgi:hypothetical protein
MAVKSEGNVVVTVDGNNFTAYCNSSDLAAAVDKLDTTDFASTAKESIAGLAEWTIGVGGHWDATLDGYIRDSGTPKSGVTASFAVTDASSTTVTYTWTNAASFEAYSINASVGAIVAWSASLMLSGAPTVS